MGPGDRPRWLRATRPFKRATGPASGSQARTCAPRGGGVGHSGYPRNRRVGLGVQPRLRKRPRPCGRTGARRTGSASAALGYPRLGSPPAPPFALEVPTRTPPPQSHWLNRPQDHLLRGRITLRRVPTRPVSGPPKASPRPPRATAEHRRPTSLVMPGWMSNRPPMHMIWPYSPSLVALVDRRRGHARFGRT